jgi:hypothetical protein
MVRYGEAGRDVGEKQHFTKFATLLKAAGGVSENKKG